MSVMHSCHQQKKSYKSSSSQTLICFSKSKQNTLWLTENEQTKLYLKLQKREVNMKKERSQSLYERSTKRKFKTKQALEVPQDVCHLQKSTEFIKIMKKQQCRRLNHELIEFHRRNFLNRSEESSSFKEQWENKKSSEERHEEQILIYQSPIEILLAFSKMACFSATIWISNIQFFFGANQHSFLSSYFYIIPLLFFIFDLTTTVDLKIVLTHTNFKNILTILGKPGLCILFFILKIAAVEISHSPLWLIIEIPCLYILLTKASQFYKSFRVMSLSKKYEYHFKAFDLIFSLMQVAHVIAIILFQIAQNGEDVTWMSELHIQGQNSLIQYIYSFYFGCTTILTVGYGDLTPKNHIEIVAVCFIELFGIAIFAYLISEIGYNLGSLRKDREIVEKDLSILQKCREYYQIQPNLIIKARSNLLNNKEAVNRLKPEEQKQLVMKLSQPLRQEIMNNNSLSVLKSCIFFLCRWSKQFQKALSQSLTSALYTPGQQLYQPPGNQRIYIIRFGKIDFFRKQRGNKQQAQKLIKSLKIDLNTQVSNNSFGYTAIIGRKPTVLEVVSRDFTSAYFIDKEKFARCVNQTPSDFQYYHQIRDKIQQSRFPQALQIPVLSSRIFHYNPSRSHLIKLQNAVNRELINKRTSTIRSNRRDAKKGMIKSKIFGQKEVAQVREAFLSSLEEITLRDQQQNKSRTSIELNVDQKMIGNTVIHVGQILAQVGTVKCITVADNSYKEQGKQYTNFYPLHNMEAILSRYDRNIPFQSTISIKHQFQSRQLCFSMKKTKSIS